MHSILSPSSAGSWVKCPGRVKAQQTYPQTTNDAAQEGTACHELAADLVKRFAVNDDPRWSDYDGQQASNGVLFDEEMFEAALLYAENVRSVMQSAGVFGGDHLQIEQQLSIPRIHEQCFGTPDCSLFDLQSGKLYVWDFKYGRRAVEATDNWQMVAYAVGLVDQITNEDQYIDVEMRIVQPRAFHPDGSVRSWSIKASDLRGYVNQLAVAAQSAISDEPITRAGPQCQYCAASHTCRTLQNATAEVTDRIELLELNDLEPEQMAVELGYLRKAQTLLNQRLNALEAEAIQQIKNGSAFPGYTIGHGRGSVKWNRSDSEVIAVGDLMGVDLRRPESPVTPTQAKKLNIDHSVINTYSEKQPGSERLVENSNTLASRIFKETN